MSILLSFTFSHALRYCIIFCLRGTQGFLIGNAVKMDGGLYHLKKHHKSSLYLK